LRTCARRCAFAKYRLYRSFACCAIPTKSFSLSSIPAGLEVYRATGAGLALPYYLSILGDACIQACRSDDARGALDEGVSIAERSDELLPPDLDQTFSSVLQAQAGQIKSAAQLASLLRFAMRVHPRHAKQVHFGSTSRRAGQIIEQAVE